MIQSKEILDIYRKFWADYNRSYGTEGFNVSDLPEELRECLDKYHKLHPKSCTPAVIRELYVEYLKAIEPDFVADDRCSPTIDLICQRVARSADFNAQSHTYSLEKGIVLLGGIGSGKTLLMRGLVKLYGFFDYSLTMLPTYRLTEVFQKDGVKVYGSFLNSDLKDVRPTTDNLILDDMGAETVVSHFGQVTNVVAEVLLRRYDEAQITFGTSNLDQKSLRNYYGERVWSRMKSMFNFIELKGDDRRK